MSNERIEAILEDISKQIIDQSRYGYSRETTSRERENGVLISINNAAALLDHIDKLEKLLNPKIEDAKEITEPSELVAGKYYWLVSKRRSIDPKIERLEDHPGGGVFFCYNIWASEHNAQAFDRWRIFGEVPVPEYIKALNK